MRDERRRQQPSCFDHLLAMFCCLAPPSADGRSGAGRGDHAYSRGGARYHTAHQHAAEHTSSTSGTFASTTALLSERGAVSGDRTFPRGYRAPPMPSLFNECSGSGGGLGGDDGGEGEGVSNDSERSWGDDGDQSTTEHERLLKKLKGDPIDSGDVRMRETRGGTSGEGEEMYECDVYSGDVAQQGERLRRGRSLESNSKKAGGSTQRQSGHHHRTGSEPTWVGSYGRSAATGGEGAGGSSGSGQGIPLASASGSSILLNAGRHASTAPPISSVGIARDGGSGAGDPGGYTQARHRRGTSSSSVGVEAADGSRGSSGCLPLDRGKDSGLPLDSRCQLDAAQPISNRGEHSDRESALGMPADALGLPAGSGTGSVVDENTSDRLKYGHGGSDGVPKPGIAQLAKVAGMHKVGRSMSSVSLADEDCCPTCFDEYSHDNPKMPLVCGHHFHLGCVFEWYERSDKCPVCEEKMEFEPSTGMCL
eukprot:CAMPEP_0181358610 /NCGR_PEP_ID=MMETSP1106-20121128/5608_1 /TAXON_ID=81844 /ORGANISM="Mantoniella antarctica, Strain SL-175" /LENGTH=478 /DNA_ID=CAMNT_0023471595 /DNA_START=373 /DNA_END=1809 /DNA_ORIENTATION=-